MICNTMPIKNLTSLESRLVQLFEEHGYVESYIKNQFHEYSPHHIYFLKNLHCKKHEIIQCGIKYSKVYDYIEFTIYVSFDDTPEQTLRETMYFDYDRFDDSLFLNESNPRSKFEDIVMHDIEKFLSKSERMCDFLHLVFEAGHWIKDVSERCEIHAYCGNCGMETVKVIDICRVVVFQQTNPLICEEYVINDSGDFDKIDLNKHICVR